MYKNCIVICGGGGKTTLFNKNPKKYLDIDYYIWNDTERKLKLEEFLLYLNQLFQENSEQISIQNGSQILLYLHYLQHLQEE